MTTTLTTDGDVLLNHVEGMLSSTTQDNKIMPFAVEAAWVTRRWESLSKFLKRYGANATQDFNISVAGLFELVRKQAGYPRHVHLPPLLEKAPRL